MIELIQQNLAFFILIAPLGLIGIWRWSVFFFKKFQAKKYVPIQVNNVFQSNQTTFVVPVYNEDPDNFRHALSTWMHEKPGEIILVIDHTDSACLDIAQEVQLQSSIKISIINTTRKGKREALVDGIRETKTDFVCLIDSDTFFEEGILPILLAPFVDSRVGGTAPRQKVWNPVTVVQKVYRMQLEERYEVEMPFLDVGGMTTTCISGRTAMYRTGAIQHRLNELEEEYFLGTRCVSGDDKCLTRIIQRNQWLVKYQHEAVVWTHSAPELSTYLKQRVRWTRNTWRSDIVALTKEGGWVYSNSFLAFHMIDRFFQPFTLVLGPIFFFTLLFTGFYYAAGLFVLWILITRLLKLSDQLSSFPRAILTLPHYIVITYIIAVLKIYALFTIWKQGWITRWNKSRLAPKRVKDFLIGKVFPIGSTIAALLILAQGTNFLYQTAIASALDNDSHRSRVVQIADVTQEASEMENEIRNPTEFRTHLLKQSETVDSVAKRYNVLPSTIKVETISNQETELRIPVSQLRNPNSTADLARRPESKISYTPFSDTKANWRLTHLASENVIQVNGEGTSIDIADLLIEVQKQFGDEVAVYEGKGTWLLKASISVNKDATLYFTGDGVKHLKLYSSNDYFVWIASFDGSILIEDTEITSWDPAIQNYDAETDAYGRAFILAKNSGRLDIIRSELAYLGYIDFGNFRRGYPFGGNYGVSWKIEDGTLDEKIITGNLIDSNIHHNMFGIYTYGSTGHIMSGNQVHNNIDYGFDPHDDSSYIIIENNNVYDNGNHGIITSKRCFKNIIANNISINNKLHGIMLDQASDDTIVYGNVLHGNEDGIVALDSHSNYIFENEIYRNRNAGVRFNVMSSANIVFNNEIHNNPKGVYLYDGSIDNHFIENTIHNNELAIHLRNVQFNSFENNLITNNDENIKLHEQSIKNYVSSVQ